MQNLAFDVRSKNFLFLIMIFIIIAILVFTKIVKPMDDAIINYAQSIGGNQSLDLFMQILTEIGSLFYMIIFSLVLFIKKRTRRIGLILILSVLAGTIVSAYIKESVGQERPNLDFKGIPFPIPLEKDTFSFFGADTNSFPSGHATRTSAFALVIGFALSNRFPKGCYLLFLYPCLVSISRVYVLQHYPSDVIGGMILGILISGLISRKLKLHLIFEKSIT